MNNLIKFNYTSNNNNNNNMCVEWSKWLYITELIASWWYYDNNNNMYSGGSRFKGFELLNETNTILIYYRKLEETCCKIVAVSIIMTYIELYTYLNPWIIYCRRHTFTHVRWDPDLKCDIVHYNIIIIVV